jgi:sodium transport system permease protein
MNTALKRIGIVFQKECLDNLRDRRTLSNSLLLPLLGPLILTMIITLQVQILSKGADEPLTLPVVGRENAPQLIEFLEQARVKITSVSGDPKKAVQDNTHEVILVIPKTYGQAFQQGRPATVQLLLDDSRTSSRSTINRTRRVLEAYSRQIGSLRLFARGISPTIIQPMALEEQDVSTPQSRAALILNLMPYFIIFSAFIGGMYIAIDTITGERERNSLEPLIINPVTKQELVLGKLGATLLFAIVGIIETLLGFAVMLRVVPVEGLGLKLTLDPVALLAIFLIALPITLVASAVQMLIASFTRSFREALTYLSLIPLIPALPGIVLAVLPVKTEWWMMLIPTFGQQVLINQLLRAEAVNPLYVGIATLATLGAGAILVKLAIHFFARESVVFGR